MSDTTTHSDSIDSVPESPSQFDFETFIAEAESKLTDLKQRRASITQRRTQYDTAKNKVDQSTLDDIKLSEEIKEDLEKVEYELASELIGIVGEENLAWKHTGEGFWVFFRYAGIGFIIAVILHQLIQ